MTGGPRCAPVAGLLLAATTLAAAGCIGGRFETKSPGSASLPDPPTRALVDRVTAARAARGLPPGDWVPDLAVAALRAATVVARGDQSLQTAARLAAQGGVTALGRHVWSFAADCADVRQFMPPPLVVEQKVLLFGAAAVPGPAGHSAVLLLIADPGTSALRAEQMGGGRGGSNPTLETYAHPSAATSPCGQIWPVAARVPL